MESKIGCKKCDGKGYFEYKTGVVSEHIPYIEEIAKEPCDCVLEYLRVNKGNSKVAISN